MRPGPLPLSDCEAVRDSGIAQPLNAGSALAYVGVGAWLVARAPRARTPVVARSYGLAVAALGGSSVLYHAVGGAVARWLHDVTVSLPLILIATAAGATAAGATAAGATAAGATAAGTADGGGRSSTALAAGGVAVAVSGGVLAVAPGLAVPAAAVAGAAAVAATAWAGGFRRGRRPGRGATVALAAAALPLQVWGRTGGPLCRDGLPAHATWHVLTALALGAAGVAFVEPLRLRPSARAEPPA